MDTIEKKGGFKKKKPDGLIVDNIDNTAPVKKIVDDLEINNHQAFSFLNANRRPRYFDNRAGKYNKHFLLPGQQLAAFPEDWEGDLSLNYFQPFRYKSMMPKMIAEMANQLKQDPLAEYLQIKQNWFSELLCQKASVSKYKTPLIDNVTEHSDEVVSCPKHFVDMARHMETDPDPYFNSSYNWYYAGNGNLQLIYINNKEYLLCSEFHLCYIFELNRDMLTYNTDTITVFDCGEGNNICESICSYQNIIALRTKHKVFVLKIFITDDKLEIQKLKVSESIKPYTSISFDEYHNNILYVTDLNNQLKIVNLDRLTARTIELRSSVKSLVDNWNIVVGNERGYYTHVATNAVTLYDKRMNNSVRRWSNPNRVSDYAWCNRISAAKYSPRRPYLYFATNHHLFLMDMRYQKNLALKPIQRWTHGMKSFPTYISICNFEHDKELVCLSSQWCEDTTVVPNYLQSELDEPEFKGMTVPYRLPSILQTLSEARLQSLCMSVYKLIENRLVTALTGNLLIQHGEKYVVLSQNSLGDITRHELYPEHMATFIEDDGPQALHEWSQNYEIEKKDFVMSCVKDISQFWKYLAVVPDGTINRRYENEKSNFSEQEVLDAFENEELDEGLLDAWLDEEETKLDDTEDKSVSSLSLNITKEID